MVEDSRAGGSVPDELGAVRSGGVSGAAGSRGVVSDESGAAGSGAASSESRATGSGGAVADESGAAGSGGVSGEPGGEDAVAGADGPRTALVVVAVVAVLAALLVAVLATRDPSVERVTKSPLIGKQAPAILGPTLDGEVFDLTDQRGRWVVVNFFATWCIPCLEEHSDLVAFDEAHARSGDATVVSVLFDDEPDDAREVFEERGGDWPVVIDDEGAVGVAYGVARVPESFLVAPDGTVVQRLVGGVTREQLDAMIDRLEAAAQGQVP